MKTQIEIKSYSSADEECLMKIIEAEGEEWQGYSAPEVREKYQKLLRESITYVAYENDELCGYSRSIADGHIAVWVVDLLVAPKFRGKDIGRQLMECVWKDFPNHAVYVMSDVDEYYKKQEYQKIGSIFQVSNSKQIPHYVRDDDSLHVGIGVSGGGFAATAYSPSFHSTPSFRRSEATEESVDDETKINNTTTKQ